eukprot:3176494-Heterocapsa_arctica.AAC.1
MSGQRSLTPENVPLSRHTKRSSPRGTGQLCAWTSHSAQPEPSLPISSKQQPTLARCGSTTER